MSESSGTAMTYDGKPLLGPLLRQAFRWFADATIADLEAKGMPPLSITQMDIFTKLDPGGITISELARRSGVARQSAHQAVGELVKAGVLRIEPDPSSTRSKLVLPTEAGLERLRIARRTLAEAERRLVDRLGEDVVDQLRAALDADWGPPHPAV
ncbi:MarR family winged helix-turn-helix transcriptional regulator [Amycolatopsis sp. CA-230715]|uniref:MarR family winged helix-turn-helix transcriptional regulator n=1 Tax=Amycolatopsis sp. CA-230715 TaxID=2745196 RepID=UPI0020B2F8C1|nr:MarR family winged helix-turn-helix transcriptional regulator [Amycolatopsis sp. CA-230715]